MIERDITEISQFELESLISNSVAEGKTIEYKGELSLTKDDQKLKFLRGIASFANASGGDMIFGIEAVDGKPVALKPLANFNPDAEILRIRDIIRAGIDPKIFLLEFKAVELSGGGHILVIRVRKSWAGAHMVTYNNDFRFFARDLVGRRPMDVSEIRGSFTFAEAAMDRINRFRSERLANIMAQETPCALDGEAYSVVHLFPLQSFDPGFQCNLDKLRKNAARFWPIAADGCSPNNDFEGFFTQNGLRGKAKATGYALAFRNGCIEGVDTEMLHLSKRDGKVFRLITPYYLERVISTSVAEWFAALKVIGADAPVVVMLSFLNVKGYSIYRGPGYASYESHPISRDHLIISGQVVETLEVESIFESKPNSTFSILRPSFDALWNACGYPRSYNYEDSGRWNPQ